ncbi:sensory histidine kinase CreC [compost metagenome]
MHKAIHDLKNPLTSISLTSELLKRKAEDPKMVISFCERLEKANQRLFANLEKLKFSFPVEDNHFKLVINEINLDELLSDIKSTANKININTENKIEKNIYADYNRLKEAIILLIGYIHPTEDSNVIMKCYSKDKQAIIQFSSPRSNFDNQDTNLTISKTLIEMHGGKTETDGNSFVIYLPSENL